MAKKNGGGFPGSTPNDSAGISSFADGDFDDDAPIDLVIPDAPSTKGNIPVAAVIDRLMDTGAFFASAEKAYFQHHAVDPTDPDSWEAPMPVSASSFKREVTILFPRITAKSAKMKEVLALAEDQAFKTGHLPRHAFAQQDGANLRILISPAIIIEVSTAAIRPLRNGPDCGAFLVPPPDFAPISFKALKAVFNVADATQPALHHTLLHDMPPPIETDPISADENRALVRAWWLGIFLMPFTQGRPVLGFFGAFQSGKTVTARTMGKLFYGDEFEVSGTGSGGRAVKDLEAEMNAMPLVVRDDMNRQPDEIVDKMCQMATGAKLAKSAFHETLSYESFRVHSNLAVTAHSPEWALRADLLSRLVPIRLARPDHLANHLPEKARYTRAVAYRVHAFAETIVAIHHGMQKAAEQWVCTTRFEDWETQIRRCAEAGGWHGLLHTALAKLDGQRVRMATDTDPWASALYQVALDMKRRRDSGDFCWFTAADLYDFVSRKLGGQISMDPDSKPSAVTFRNQGALSSWLSKVEQRGGAVVEVMRGPLNDQGATQWCLLPKSAL